ncbi:serine/threonine-protein kinase-like protein psk1 [Mytilinidion resinicola]|uniref:Serine/threonine-protein kinase-like protein psk1 n=1 Tax=Mytilinidion resinicola TaxID=574789 RepID=A0A6A6Y565_9PEZI|nr:serine/threonine-protein kinase-like protein psk1 [Mytilinidion resinicola]KAF2803800.1 serine/threonine-protein kinase-like protein psk1 [Mytilinidion resinicola]
MGIDRPATTAGPHTGTPPINISSPAMRPADSAKTRKSIPPAEKLDFDVVLKKAKKNKKKKKAMKPGAPAMTTIRGFHTPVTSGGEESDYSVIHTPRLGPTIADFGSVTSSPSLRPISAAGGISSLKQKLEALSISSGTTTPTRSNLTGMLRSGISSNASVSGLDSDSDRTEMESYEVNFETDFVSSSAPAKTDEVQEGGDVRGASTMRKMTASDFEPLTCLGKGSYGTVLLVKQRETGRLYAQKQFRKASMTVHKKLIEQTKTERAILESVNRHAFVVKLYYAFQDHEKLYLILEYAQGGELFHHLAAERMFPEETVAFYMAEMVLALDHLHRTVGVIYRDLKPENCLLDSEGHLLLTDFGLSKVACDGETNCNSFLGTIEYMAPEVIAGVKYGMAVDWWSFGALGFDLLTGAPPFAGNNHAKIQEKILKQKLVLPYYLGPDAKDLLTRLLRKEPKKRLGANMPKDLKILKEHRFFRKLDWLKLEKRELVPPIQPLITDPELAENFANEFTDLALSPVSSRKSTFSEYDVTSAEQNPFGGFSFVASQSLLDGGDWGVY